MYNFEQIKNEKTMIGGLQGEYKVKLSGFDVKPDSKGAPNYKFEFELVDFPGRKHTYCTSSKSWYKTAIAGIGTQLGFEQHVESDDVKVLTKASKEVFSIWINNGYTNFRALEVETEEAISEDMI